MAGSIVMPPFQPRTWMGREVEAARPVAASVTVTVTR
jgi:hypothetical protein